MQSVEAVHTLGRDNINTCIGSFTIPTAGLYWRQRPLLLAYGYRLRA
jgi:hypothetical protein